MKKIIFCLETLTLGGVEKELSVILKKIKNSYDITVLLLYQDAPEILKLIPESVNLKIVGIDKKYYCGSTFNIIRQRLKKKKFFEAADIGLKRLFNCGMTHANTNLDNIPKDDNRYDVAVCYHCHSPLMLKVVAEKIEAGKKIAWIHNDFSTTGYKIGNLKKYVKQYDEFIAVSKKVELEFKAACPWYSGHIETAYNYLDSNEIIELSQQPTEDQKYFNEEKIKILTVGRFSKQKGIDLAIKTSFLLKKANVDFHWFLIGYGKLEDYYKNLINKYQVADCFSIIGKKENPYPYINNCDIYVQPSRHEAYPLTIMEAKILKKAIVCTNFAGADELIENGKNGIIVPLNDCSALCETLIGLIHDSGIRLCFTKELEFSKMGNDISAIEKHFR